MAGAFIDVQINDADVQALFGRLIERGEDFSGVLGLIGEQLLDSTRQRFSTHESPDGDLWAAVSETYAQRKAAGRATSSRGDAKTRDPGQLLYLTGQLYGGLNYQVEGDTLLLGSPEIYAATHQFGRGPIPARPFLGLSQDDEQMIEDVLGDFLGAALP